MVQCWHAGRQALDAVHQQHRAGSAWVTNRRAGGRAGGRVGGSAGGWLAAMQLASVRVPNEVRACERRARRPPWRPQVAKMHAAAEAFNEVTLGPWTA